MIYDCFLFFNELELLKIRMEYLWDTVDKFVLVEATTTFSGNQKPLYFDNVKTDFDKYKDKLIHIVVDLPSNYSAWEREYYHRNCLMLGAESALPDDVIILSDIDEIPKISGILDYKDRDGIIAFMQKRYDYYLNYFYFDGWHGPTMAKKKYISSAQSHRRSGYHYAVVDGGWHFSHLGGAEVVKLKLQSFSHQECNRPDIIDNLDEMCKTGMSYYLDHGPIRIEEIDNSFPEYLVNNKEYYKSIGYIREVENVS